MTPTPPPSRRRVRATTDKPPLPPAPPPRPRPAPRVTAPRPQAPPRILPPGIPTGVKPVRPKPTGFRFRNLLPYIGLILLLVGISMMIPKNTSTTADDTDTTVPVIVVDAGHGGHDRGASKNGLVEKDMTLDTALRVERLLQKRGFTVVMTRRDDRFLELYDRAQVANAQRRALFVSIHFNDNTTVSGEGVETYYASEKVVPSGGGWFQPKVEPPPADNGAAFAQLVQQAVIAKLGVTNRGTKGAPFAVVRHTRCPAILVEGGFINNPAEARKLKEPRYRELLATAIAEGVAAYHNQRVLAAAQPKVAKGS